MQRIGHELRGVGHFRLAGQDLGQQRIVGVARTNPGQVGLRHEHAEGGRGSGCLGRQFLRQSEPATEFDRIADRPGEDGSPVLAGRYGVGDRHAGAPARFESRQ